MHKFLVNVVNQLKPFNARNLISKKNFKHEAAFNVTQSGSYCTSESGNKKGFINFDEMVTQRRMQAQRSILVQVNSVKSFPELQKYCSQYGTIVGAHHYKLDDVQYILVEYSDEVEAKEAIEDSTFNDSTGASVRSPFLWFRAAQNGTAIENCKISGELVVTDGNRGIDYNEINEMMLSAESVSDQMLILYNATVLNDLGIRLRFLAAFQIEKSISGMFPSAVACPFGSSVNGFARLGCDLDLILRLTSIDKESVQSKRLIFHIKDNATNVRSQMQRHLENLSDTMHFLLPGISHIRRILQARVPIVRYHHEILDLEVDLSMSNMSGVYMSELLYIFAQIDDRVSPLVFCIRRWAQTSGLTNPSPGFWITNFSLTCLVIFYLQQLSQPVLPSINYLSQQARKGDTFADNDVRCTFLRDLNLLKFPKANKDTLSELLVGFFEFYSQMTFERAISLNDAKLHIKSDHSAMYIINPLEPNVNVSKNVSFEECERFRIEIRNAAWILESSEKVNTVDAWGLVNLFQLKQQKIVRPIMFYNSRMVEVKALFDGAAVKSGEKSEFKNGSVANEVDKPQRRVRTELKSSGRKR